MGEVNYALLIDDMVWSYSRIKAFEDCPYDYVDGLTWAEAQDSNELRTVFRDGKFEKQFTLDEVRKNLHGGTF